MIILYIPCGIINGETIYLTHHIGRSIAEVTTKIMDQAEKEGFRGTIKQRLDSLQWKIAKIALHDVAIVDI